MNLLIDNNNRYQDIIKDIGFQIYLEYILYVWMYFFQ